MLKHNFKIAFTTILFCCAFLLSWQLKAENVLNSVLERPSNTVRVSTGWTEHNLSTENCISRALTILAKENTSWIHLNFQPLV